jgi:C-terminal processing protease CtpA/Prc
MQGTTYIRRLFLMHKKTGRNKIKESWAWLAALAIAVIATLALAACMTSSTADSENSNSLSGRNNTEVGTPDGQQHNQSSNNENEQTTENEPATANEPPSTDEPTTQDNRNEADDLGASPPITLELDELETLQPNRIAELGIKTRVVRAGDDIPDFELVFLVIDVAPNTAGSQAGIVDGDLILTINGEPAVGRPLPQFADAIIGMEGYLSPIPGMDFIFRIMRDGVELELTAFIA